MKKKFIAITMLLAYSSYYSQVGINTDTPDQSSVLDIVSTKKGILLPRLTTTQINAISNPANSLTVFDTTKNCLSTNYGTPTSPNWICAKKEVVISTDIPSTISSTQGIVIQDPGDPAGALNWQTWVDVPQLTTTFTIKEETPVNFSWTLFSGIANGHGNALTNDMFAQMFTGLSITGGGYTGDVIPESTNYLPMIHNPGGANFFALMNNSSFNYVKNFQPGTYTVQVKIYAAAFLGTLNAVLVGVNGAFWTGGTNMTDAQKINSASNKLSITIP